MAGLDQDPLSTMASAIRTAWGMVLAPLAAILIGIALGLFAAGIVLPFYLMMAICAALPFAAFTSLGALVVGVAAFACLIRFWLSEEHRIGPLLALCGLVELQVYWLAREAVAWPEGLWAWLRFLLCFTIVPAAYTGLHYYSKWRLRQLEREAEEAKARRLNKYVQDP